jgi:hypothetical protein
MARFRTTVFSRWDQDTAFRYMSDFSNAAAWDPGVRSARKINEGEVGLGTKFELVTSFNGRELPLTYVVTVFEPPRRMVVRAETDKVLSLDDVTLHPAPGGTNVTYDASLRTRGWFQLTAPVVALLFKGIGERARAGLERELNG